MMKPALAVVWTSLIGCGPRAAWMHDESRRIDEGMHAEQLLKNGPAVSGVYLEGAPQLAPPRAERGYALDGGSGKAKTPARPRAKKKGRKEGAQLFESSSMNSSRRGDRGDGQKKLAAPDP